MSRETRSRKKDNNPGVRPVLKVELSEKNKRLKVIAIICFLAIALIAFGIGMFRFLSKDPGWQEISVNVSNNKTCAQEFTLQYHLGASGISATAENKKITALYTDTCEKAYSLFSAGEEFDDTVNVCTLNKNPNKTYTVDPVLYAAFETIADSGNRSIYLGPAYGYWQSLFNCESDADAADFDPLVNEELSEYYNEIAAFARDAEQVNLELLGDGKVRLNVSKAYLAFAENNGISVYMDFFWMKNAFIADYIADTLTKAGFTKGALSSYDGFSRCLDGSDTSYSLNLYHRRGGTVYPMAVMDYTGPKSIAVMKDFPLNKADTLNYYVTENGETRYPYADLSDGKCRAALTYLAAYSDSKGCADIILSLSSLYIADSFDADSFASLKDKGIYGIYADGDRIVHTEKSVSLRDVFSNAEITYTVE